jgi:GNAT superfamily N-acetyltransferase
MSVIRPCNADDVPAMFAIINQAAEAYRGVIPADRWHEPYMKLAELQNEIAAGVVFWGFEQAGRLVGIMGIQPVRDVDLIRHAYVEPGHQGAGIGAALIAHILGRHTARPMLVGT